MSKINNHHLSIAQNDIFKCVVSFKKRPQLKSNQFIVNYANGKQQIFSGTTCWKICSEGQEPQHTLKELQSH